MSLSLVPQSDGSYRAVPLATPVQAPPRSPGADVRAEAQSAADAKLKRGKVWVMGILGGTVMVTSWLNSRIIANDAEWVASGGDPDPDRLFHTVLLYGIAMLLAGGIAWFVWRQHKATAAAILGQGTFMGRLEDLIASGEITVAEAEDLLYRERLVSAQESQAAAAHQANVSTALSTMVIASAIRRHGQ